MLLFTNRQDDACDVVEHAFNMARQRLEQQQQQPQQQTALPQSSSDQSSNNVRLWNLEWLGWLTLPDVTTVGSNGMTKGMLPDKQTMFERRMYPSVLNNWLICRAVRDGENMTDIYIQGALNLIQEARQDVRGELENKKAVVVPQYVMER